MLKGTNKTTDKTRAALRLIHGDDLCGICGKPKDEAGLSICSYPHGMLPVKAVDEEHPEGFWTWKEPANA